MQVNKRGKVKSPLKGNCQHFNKCSFLVHTYCLTNGITLQLLFCNLLLNMLKNKNKIPHHF